MQIRASALDAPTYRPYGDVIAACAGSKRANAGTARRYDRLAALENLRPGSATPNLCLFRVTPATSNPFQLRLMERHRYSTQVFIPMVAERYLVIVCRGGDAPDLSTLKCFLAAGTQGVTYKPGTWHHPLVALDRQTDFACVVHEDGSGDDCEERSIAPVVSVAY